MRRNTPFLTSVSIVLWVCEVQLRRIKRQLAVDLLIIVHRKNALVLINKSKLDLVLYYFEFSKNFFFFFIELGYPVDKQSKTIKLSAGNGRCNYKTIVKIL